jgi:hypothetical protein
MKKAVNFHRDGKHTEIEVGDVTCSRYNFSLPKEQGLGVRLLGARGQSQSAGYEGGRGDRE